MGRTQQAQRLINTIRRARRTAGLPPVRLAPETLTLQQVEAQADSLHITPETLLSRNAA